MTTKRIPFATLLAGLALAAAAIWAPAASAEFGLIPGTFEGEALDENGIEYTQAGGHPHEAKAHFEVEFDPEGGGAGKPDGNVKNAIVDIPPGFIGNPSAVPRCPEAVWHSNECSLNSQVGIAVAHGESNIGDAFEPIYNLEPPNNAPAAFGFDIGGRKIRILGNARTDGDFGIRTITRNIPEANPVLLVEATLWGTPGDPSHDALRGANCISAFGLNWESTSFCEKGDGSFAFLSPEQAKLPELYDALAASPGVPYDGEVRPFISMGTDCNDIDPTTIFRMDSWEDPAPLDAFGDPQLGHPNLLSYPLVSPEVTGCHKLSFDPLVGIQVKNEEADTPTGVSVSMDIPQNENPNGNSTPHLKKAVVTLPEGMTINPAAGDGQGACSARQIGLTSEDPIRFTRVDSNCPQSAKIASAEVETPLLPDVLTGDVYVAKPFDNPFDSLYAMYIVLRGPGLVIKLAGKIEPDARTGRLTTTFDHNPQLTFDELRLNFFGGSRAPLATSPTCGTKTIEAELTPWSAPQSGPAAIRNNSYVADRGPANGTPCASSLASRPFAPSLAAGTGNPIAGAFAPFTMRLARPDGHQELSGLTVRPPRGFTGVLKGVPYCSEAQLAVAAANEGRDERSGPSCPVASQIGRVVTGAGAGPAPLFTEGKAYLTGPYKGAPLSMTILTPAVAGPFDLGVVPVRVALHVDPRTAQITAISDPVPQILEGVPLRVKDIRVHLDRPGFGVNPTNCEPLRFDVDAAGASGGFVRLSSPFQVGDCGSLGFKPRLGLKVLGGTKRGAHPAFRAVVRPRPGDANIGRAAVTLPRSAFLDQSHIRTICTRVQFAANSCPQGAVYGRAVAFTPLLDQPLRGPVYLRSSNNKLPDLVVDLRGPAHQPIRVELAGRIDSVKGGIRNTFELVPDAPVSKFVLDMQGGKKGLIVNSRDLCKSKNRATARLKGQNGRRYNFRPVVRNPKCGKRKRRAKRASHSRQARVSQHGAARRGA